MKIKVENYPFLKTADIFIHKINCTTENISKLIDVFEFQNNIEIIADMGFANEESFPHEKIESFKLKHNASFEKNKYSNGLFRLIASSRECKDFLKDVSEFDVEIICILSIRDENLWKQSVHYKNMALCHKLLKQNILDLYLTAMIDDSGIAITLSKEDYNAKQIASKIKGIF